MSAGKCADGLGEAGFAACLGARIAECSIGRFPEAARLAAVRAFIDTVGVVIAGADEPCVAILVRERILPLELPGTVRLWGRAGHALPDHAALVNATAAHALDFDDTGASSQGHPSAVLVPGLMALAESAHLPGWKVMEAYVVGVEVWNRLSRLCPLLHFQGLHPTGCLGVIAMAAAGSRLLGLSAAQCVHALGLSASMSGGMFENFGSMVKPMHAGMAAANGLVCARAAAAGFTASPAVFDGALGLLSMLGSEHPDPCSVVKDVGEQFALLDPGLNIKRYPSCALSDRLIDAAIALRARHGFQTNRIAEVRCHATPRAARILKFDRPADMSQGRFSAPFLVAAALLDGRVDLQTFEAGRLADPAVQSLLGRTRFGVHPDWDDARDEWRADVVEVRMVSGEVLRAECVLPEGHARKPMSLDGVHEKFMACVTRRLDARRASALLEGLTRIERIEDIREITGLTLPEGIVEPEGRATAGLSNRRG